MVAIWILIILTINVLNQKVIARVDETNLQTHNNITTLYPVANKTEPSKDQDDNEQTNKHANLKTDATTWKIETTFAESNLAKIEENVNFSHSKEKIESKAEEAANCSKEFKPSLLLGSFFDEDNFDLTPTRPTFGSFAPLKRPPVAFVSSPKEELKSTLNNIPKGKFPYKIESAILTKARNNWKPSNTLESSPTDEVPVKVPAGGLYKLPDPFNEKPEFNEDEEFGLEFNGDLKENTVKKRVNPWKNLLRIMTAFIPVGLIISALTPSVITIQSTGPNHQIPHRLYRRSDINDAAVPERLPPISEQCRRRLLCELHSEANYYHLPSSGYPRGNQCYRLHCEDPHAVSKTLRWLLAYSTRGETTYGRPLHPFK